MDFELSDDQQALQGELRRFLADRVTSDVRRAAADRPGAVDRELWRDLGGMGVFSLTVPEANGGVGMGLADATIVFEELGRAAVPGPVIGTFLAAGLDAGLDDGLGAGLSPRAAAGEAVVGVTPAGDPAFVEHHAGLDALLVVGGDAVRLVDPPAAARPVDRPLDPLTPVAVVDALPAGGEVVGGPDAPARVRAVGGLLAAALHVGLAEAAVAMGSSYAKERTQFGRVIGSFQAVKHLLADAQVQVEVARAAVHAAGVELDDADDADGSDRATTGEAGAEDAAHARRAVDVARIVASRAADRATRACIQVHGGMGFTWELDAHLYLKRALVLDVAVSGPEAAVESLAAAL
jgi:alkylation response protein AidB-like acyl-CoA dehydrogenase